MDMEKEIKIILVSKGQINEPQDEVRITCENICVWGNCLETAIFMFLNKDLARCNNV